MKRSFFARKEKGTEKPRNGSLLLDFSREEAGEKVATNKATKEKVRKGNSNSQKSAKPAFKREQVEFYEGLFLQPRELKVRQCVYISRGVHETVAEIVKRLGERGLTVGVYVDSILQQHLREHKDEINRLYCKPIGKLIE